jgi:hypothetical protein
MNKFILLSFLLSLIGITACDKEQHQLVVSPEKVQMTDNDQVFVLHLATKPGSGTKFTLSEIPEWIEVSPIKGELNNSVAEINFRPASNSLPAGIYTDVIKLTSDSKQVIDIPVSLAVKQTPWMKVEPLQLDLPDFNFTTEFSVQNTGNGKLKMYTTSSSEWLKINYGYAELPANTNATFKVTVDKKSMTPGYYESSILLTSANKQTVVLPVTVRVPELISLQLNPSSITVGYFTNQLNVVLSNQGNVPVKWNAQYAGHFTLSPSSGILPVGENLQISVVIDRKKLKQGANPSSLIFVTDSASVSIPTTVNHFNETKMALQGALKDAAYCKTTGQLITISSFPHSLMIIDPDNYSSKSIPLNQAPICVAVNKNNTKAVVGHQGRISVIDLSTQQLEKEYITLCTPLDILISSTDWVYLFQGNYGISTRQIHCVNLATGKTSLSTSTSGAYFYNMIYADMDPTEKYIYGISYNSFPAHLHKFDISKGVADFLYSSVEHGIYEMGDRLWIDESGTKIFTEGKTVFKSSTELANDFNYLGTFQLSGSPYFNSMAHSAKLKKIVVVPLNLAVIVAFNEVSMNQIQQYPLESFLVESAPAATMIQPAYGQYIFINSAGTKLYTITKAANYEQWGLQTTEL